MMVSMKQVVSVATLPVHMGDRPKRKVQGIRNQTLPPPSIKRNGHNSCMAVLQETT